MSSPSLAHPLVRGLAFPRPPSPPPRHFTGANPYSKWFPVRSSEVVRLSGGRSRIRSLGSTEESGESASEEVTMSEGFLAFRSWDVPWDWTVTALVMMPYLMSVFLAGVAKSNGMGYTLPQLEGDEEVAVKFFADQFLKTVAKLSVLYMFVSRHQPFPDDVFSFSMNTSLLYNVMAMFRVIR
ncbi:hypothetical protein Taro_041822 [Colocasia esculenta]|uniref:Uncharacterized protein n=1 Tax=Colocasia esculenta TaxID=4460 RepID=A0A843WFC3_COLES|nr:hypothetical protein [Colocasia esculenta]